MDDGLILNIADNAPVSASTGAQLKRGGQKGGRWTDRLKAKRGEKRKTRSYDDSDLTIAAKASVERRPSKRARKELPDSLDRAVTEPVVQPTSRPPTQVISSLFTSNPKLSQPVPSVQPKTFAKPSNAPLRDSSTFSGLGLDPLITTHLETKMNIQRPTSIQRAALPILLSADDTSSRDVFIQSQTGSGKTLSFLLPIIQDLLPLSTLSYIDRSIGTLAIIIAPTRELAKQISDVLEALLKLRLRPQEELAEGAESSAPRLTRWLVSGLLSGGSTRQHEKARLRKGLPILVSTPGRLLDHLQNTASFNVGKCRWLVLDEADRLMDLGFEESINGIIKGLDGRRKLAMQAVDEGKSMEVGGWDWSRQRRTILCSATIRDDVQKLAGNALINPIVIKALQGESSEPDIAAGDALGSVVNGSANFTPPSQLAQKYVVVPLKLRLVTLIALLRTLLAQAQGRRGTKIIVFLSCTDSVDFHWNLLGGTSMSGDNAESASSASDSEGDEKSNTEGGNEKEEGGRETPRRKSGTISSEKFSVKSDLLPDTTIFRLHGSLPLQARLASLRGFSSDKSKSIQSPLSSSILLCTSVASRGLDLPLVRAVIQYDLPTEGGATEYVHRVGRTARVGKGGEAWSFVAPSEVEWVKWVTQKMQGDAREQTNKEVGLEPVDAELILRKGFGGKGTEYEDRATDVQLSFERWVLVDQQHAGLARKAFLSHIRAYATHPSDEKHIFHVRNLHLGHLAKAFALREAPSAVTNKAHGRGSKNKSSAPAAKMKRKNSKSTKVIHSGDDLDVGEAEKRMEKAVREQGRLTKKGGQMVSSGTSEFQIAGGYDLESLVNRT